MKIPQKSFQGLLPPFTDVEILRGERLKSDVIMLADTIGERNTGCYDNLLLAQSFVADSFEELGYMVRIESYDVDGFQVANVEAERIGSEFPDEIIVVGAHYDTVRGSVGANDNASGVSGLLELARMFKDHPPERTIRFVAFTCEEPPYFYSDMMGSRIYASGCKERQENIIGMICIDCLGWYSDEEGSQQIPYPMEASNYPDTANFVLFCSNEESLPLFNKCINEFRSTTAFPCEGIVSPESEHPTFLSWADNINFWREDYQAIIITDTALFRSSHYHTPSDTYEKIDYQRMSRVVGGVGRVVESLAEIRSK